MDKARKKSDQSKSVSSDVTTNQRRIGISYPSIRAGQNIALKDVKLFIV